VRPDRGYRLRRRLGWREHQRHHAAVGMVKSLALDLAADGITVNAVLPAG
jgi:hypothetical protein